MTTKNNVLEAPEKQLMKTPLSMVFSKYYLIRFWLRFCSKLAPRAFNLSEVTIYRNGLPIVFTPI